MYEESLSDSPPFPFATICYPVPSTRIEQANYVIECVRGLPSSFVVHYARPYCSVAFCVLPALLARDANR